MKENRNRHIISRDISIILFICAIGTVIRLMYGFLYHPWQTAPDHLAFELIIEQGIMQYDHLIHYPHEGGSIIISLLCHVIESVTSLSSLTVLAAIFDFIIRFGQIVIVKNVFNRQTAFAFALWTVFSSPILIPWGTLSYGLHYVSSIFPFILIFLNHQKSSSAKHQFLSGTFLGLALWFSYSNIILIPIYFIFQLLQANKTKNFSYSAIGFTFIFLCHLMVRFYFDTGFHLNEFEASSIRGLSLTGNHLPFWKKLLSIPITIANSQLALPQLDGVSIVFHSLFYIFCLVSGIGLHNAHTSGNLNRNHVLSISIIVTFLIAYAFGPFVYTSPSGNHTVFRHIAYIAPLISAVLITGLLFLKRKYWIVLFLSVTMVQSSRLFLSEKNSTNENSIKAAGWILATKLGHNPEYLIPIVSENPSSSNLLLQGIGWGTSTALFNGCDNLSISEIDLKINKLIDLLHRYPPAYQQYIFDGIEYSFSNHVTPRLNKDFLTQIKAAYFTSKETQQQHS